MFGSCFTHRHTHTAQHNRHTQSGRVWESLPTFVSVWVCMSVCASVLDCVRVCESVWVCDAVWAHMRVRACMCAIRKECGSQCVWKFVSQCVRVCECVCVWRKITIFAYHVSRVLSVCVCEKEYRNFLPSLCVSWLRQCIKKPVFDRFLSFDWLNYLLIRICIKIVSNF